jgi:hypothetical protein
MAAVNLSALSRQRPSSLYCNLPCTVGLAQFPETPKLSVHPCVVQAQGTFKGAIYWTEEESAIFSEPKYKLLSTELPSGCRAVNCASKQEWGGRADNAGSSSRRSPPLTGQPVQLRVVDP